MANDLTNESFASANKTKKREVFRFNTDWLISSVDWCNETSESLKLALCSYAEDYKNFVQLVSLTKDEHDQEIRSQAIFKHPYPATKILWNPKPNDDCSSSLLATTADYLRIWQLEGNHCDNTTSRGNNSFDQSIDSSDKDIEVKLACLLNKNQGSRHCAPLTSFDWNDIDPSLIVTASVDTTCAIWNIETSNSIGQIQNSSEIIDGNLKTQVVAHDDQVYDVSFSRLGSGRDIFVSSSGDGSVRLFDLRRLSTSKVLYEVDKDDTNDRALVRVSCSKQDTNLVSTFATNSHEILIIDIRNPGKLVTKLANHSLNVNGMSWAPHLPNHLCSVSDDCQALIWDLSKLPNSFDEPVLAYCASGKINSVNWSTTQPDWISITFRDCLELLRV